ncbi:NlpC/P60 family protein [Lichenibacterium dinghuense]|uniref:NlpC/P60 family protein n=1 Tax=Lichenibacterium dinghuense TaxID=2895977 RepID=UPI001F3DF47B|nr:NlpC/P60 family protein [Lichenibacterium sp. 6Y81]
MRRRNFLAGGLAAAAFGPAGPALAAGDDGVVPRRDWYGDDSRARWGSWGPPARVLPAPAGLADDRRDIAHRVLSQATRLVGLGYQHHHLPEFDPPAGWPWRPVSAGANGRGLDCSNFTSLAFNRALGIKLPTAVGEQAEATVVGGPGGRGSAALSRIAPGGYAEAVAALRPADLLFITSDAGRLSHVVLWMGAVRGVPSFVDCTDSVRLGPDGSSRPTGVQVRAFLPDSWYGRRFSHALRLESLGGGSGPAPAFADGGDV